MLVIIWNIFFPFRWVLCLFIFFLFCIAEAAATLNGAKSVWTCICWEHNWASERRIRQATWSQVLRLHQWEIQPQGEVTGGCAHVRCQIWRRRHDRGRHVQGICRRSKLHRQGGHLSLMILSFDEGFPAHYPLHLRCFLLILS